ncbi:alpha/beta fold hydrolase [Pseudonocardia halophobica]|uniref:ABC transporter ATP-binding protein n=1 Tax=Pseudonocardia halophobica TaxID=29401 RepID=A0A9W6L6T7_9PSEU|nr:alpha/beta fold hydrolase [Pseudonocardia halophobica]GLL13145.1 ABC transporter ATP-binding protein [Pseudonocardia halophobica]
MLGTAAVATVALLVLTPGTAAAATSTNATIGSTPTPVPTSADIRTSDQRIDVRGGPGVPGTVSLDTTLYLPETTPAPAVLVAHGFGGNKRSVDTDARQLADRGYVVLTWSARGFGASGGQIALDSPDHEVADAEQLVDWLGGRPEVQQDGPGDPRVGVTGGSYGGALSLLLAGYDRRVDALAPVITWNDLSQALFPNAGGPTDLPEDTPARGTFGGDGVFKRGWAGVFFSSGSSSTGGAAGATGATDDSTGSTNGAAPTDGSDTSDTTGDDGSAAGSDTGSSDTGSDANGSSDDTSSGSNGSDGTTTSTNDLASALGARTGGGLPASAVPPAAPPVTCGRFTAEVCAAYTEAATTGRLSPATEALLRRSSPVSVTDRITAPTLIVQGEQDTLFGLDQADANARQIAAHGTPVKLAWYAGGHDGAAAGQAVRDQIGEWFDFHLRGTGEDPGTSFSYEVESGIRAGRTTTTSRTVVADAYPGLSGAAPVTTQALPLTGQPQVVANPAGGNPAAITSLPGLGGALGSLGSRLSAFTADLPGQSALFAGPALTAQTDVAGAPRLDVTVSRMPGQPAADEAVLFAKTYEVGQDGLRQLLGNAVAPVRVAVPTDGSPARVSITLPGVVAPIEVGNRLVVSISTTDQGFASPAEPAVWRIGLAEGAALAVPVVPGRAVTTSTVPVWPLVGIGVVLLLSLVGWLVAKALRRRREVPPAGAADAPPLEISGLAKTYKGGFSAVKEVSFTVQPGMVLGLLGPNGAGKTTVLRMLMGLISPTSGSIRAFGEPVGPGAPVLARIGAFVEGPGFLPHLSGADNLRLYWAATGRPTEEAHLEEALEVAGLGESVHRRVGTYSQGMRQRLAIAQAMLGLPELLVLDEPTNGLDPPQIHAMRELLRRYAEGGRTVLVSSHLLAEVEQTCTHVVVMHHGRVVADGTVDDIIAGGGAASFGVDVPERAVEVLAALDGVRDVAAEGRLVHAELNGTPRASAVQALVAAGISVESAGPRRRLEDAFLQLVGEDTAP